MFLVSNFFNKSYSWVDNIWLLRKWKCWGAVLWILIHENSISQRLWFILFFSLLAFFSAPKHYLGFFNWNKKIYINIWFCRSWAPPHIWCSQYTGKHRSKTFNFLCHFFFRVFYFLSLFFYWVELLEVIRLLYHVGCSKTSKEPILVAGFWCDSWGLGSAQGESSLLFASRSSLMIRP